MCMEDCDDSTFTLHNNMIEGKIGNTGEECGIVDEQHEKGNHSAEESDTNNQKHTEAC